ncbi:universal stress protein [Halorientalis pallida]|uniref:universal stress protein n=1 Tax=Halorientalis pallida TaxID=2479928 RepID=UPI00187D1842|nr:universal stress protein [Halorientalis pallida]
MYERILVPTDGSTGTAHVAMQALDLAEQYDSTVYVLHVVDETASSLLEATGSENELEEQGERAVERIERMAQVHGVDTVTEIRTGDPASGIIDYAEETEADLIVAGTHGRSGVQRRLIGSVAERLVRHATCPVMTVRLPESDETVTDEADARELAEEALAQSDRGDGEITGVERQVSVWVVDIESDEGESLVAYIDPVTQRTSLVARH